MNKQLDTLFQREMTRKEFITTLGFGAASVMGFSSVIHFLTGRSAGSHRRAGIGYGSSVYGGRD